MSDEEIHQYLTRDDVLQKLNLAKHRVQGTHKEVVLCTDIEIHTLKEGRESNYFVLDFARILPPTNPSGYGNSVFFRLFRSELLADLNYPISSDAYSSFQDPSEAIQLNQAANTATEFLVNKINKLFSVANIDSFLSMEDIDYVMHQNPQYSSIQPKDYFTRKLHKNGINIRYMGLILVNIYQNCPKDDKFEKKISFVLSLMIIRILKNVWRFKIQMEQTKNIQDVSLVATVEMLNQLHRKTILTDSNVVNIMKEMFVTGILSSQQFAILKSILKDYEDKVNIFFVTLSFTQMCGIELNTGTVSSLVKHSKGMVFTEADIQNFYAVLKSPPIISFLSSLYYISSAKLASTNASKNQFFHHALLQIEYALGFNYQTEILLKLHDFVSFEMLKYNRETRVHWENIFNRVKKNTQEFQQFCGIPEQFVHIWPFFLKPLCGTLQSEGTPTISNGGPGIDAVIKKLWSSGGSKLLKQLCEYLFEKQQYLNSNLDKDHYKMQWNNFLSKPNIDVFMQHVISRPSKFKLNINDVQYWDINYDKKWIMLFFNQQFLLESTNANDVFTHLSLFSHSPISKALLFDYSLYCNINKVPEEIYIHKIFSKCKNIEDPIFHNFLTYNEVSYYLYMRVIDIDSSFTTFFLLNNGSADRTIDEQYKEKLVPQFNVKYVTPQKIWRRDYNMLSYYILGSVNHVTSMDLTEAFIGNEGALMISKCLKITKSLSSLCLTYNQIGQDGAYHISESLKNNNSVTSISLKGNPITIEGVKSVSQMLKQNSTILFLDLSGITMEGDAVQPLSDALNSNSTLTSLNLYFCKMGPEGAKLFSSCLKSNSSLKSLSLTSSNIDNDGFISLFTSIQSNPKSNLETFNIASNNINKDGFNSLLECLKAAPLSSLNLHGLKIGTENAANLFNHLKDNRTVTTVYLSYNNIESDVVNPISECLKVNQTLSTIDLSDTNIGEKLSLITDALKLNSTVTSLSLIRTSIGIKGAKLLSDYLKESNSIVHLNLLGNSIEWEGTQAISESLRINTSLRGLILTANSIGNKGLKAIADTLIVNSTLISLDLTSKPTIRCQSYHRSSKAQFLIVYLIAQIQ
eukprot:TRINITY_DN1815_c0_g1_i6.p1 TRINITY_DN1815_c0_g1~~TRINITY_DN1815_c0_g1_i6.p1  ORF type:complete len:1241 (-),score=297.98 TRINITY_DN1815_c0_g1_i6:577-3831(-)